MRHAPRRRFTLLSRSRVNGGRGYPSETQVGRGHRVVHGDKELLEKLGRNDPCPCGSGTRFQAVLPQGGTLRGQ
ncbi:MAG: SEC-C metal-binding domain-containing protein [Myxococcaceae bacterium]